jgi:hypothetical protein
LTLGPVPRSDDWSESIGRHPQDSAGSVIFKPLRDDISVCDLHRLYLAARDTDIITALLVVPLPILATLVNGNAIRSVSFGACLLLAYDLCAVAAKNYGWRMVHHLLALTVAGGPSTASA